MAVGAVASLVQLLVVFSSKRGGSPRLVLKGIRKGGLRWRRHGIRPRAHVGDLVNVEGHRVGEARRIGEILEVLGDAEHEHYRVRWDDDHESVFYPSSDSTGQES